jgi:2-polyprenyl-3-methyl-5-hydroxy-6-metoxy-1,4-benzoquinol methylase
MSELGWRVAGVDVSERVVEEIRDQYGCEVHSGSLPHPELSPSSFDVVTMWQSLEHVHRPLEVLRAAFEILRPGGKIVVAVPNLDSLAAKWFGEYWFGFDLPRHLTHFTASTLSTMLKASGFRTGSVHGLVHHHWLRSSAHRAVDAGAADLRCRLLTWKWAARVTAWTCYALGRADSLVAVGERPE